MEITTIEQENAAYARAYKENKSAKKMMILFIIMLVPVIAITALILAEVIPLETGGYISIPVLLAYSYGNYRIRKPEADIAKRILTVG